MAPQIEMQTSRVMRRRRKRRYWPLVLSFTLLLMALVLAGWWYLEQQPSKEWAALYPKGDYTAVVDETEQITYQLAPILLDGSLFSTAALLHGEEIMLPFDFLKGEVDPYIFWDESIESVIVTTEDKILRFPQGAVEAYVNDSPFTLTLPVKKVNGTLYLPYSSFSSLYPLEFEVIPEDERNSTVVVIHRAGVSKQTGAIVAKDEKEESIVLRASSSIKSPIVAQVQPGDEVILLGEEKNWFHVEAVEGMVGFLPKMSVKLGEIKMLPLPEPPRRTPVWYPLGTKINLTWEQVYRANPDLEKLGTMPSLNVVSPTWFELVDDQGSVKNKAASLDYVAWAHERNYQVWALFSNGFEPEQTHAMLSDYEKRKRVIQQLLQFAQMYQLDGINLDFENVYLKDKENLVQFVRELTPYLHEMGLVVSVDVTIHSTSEMWSMFYDRGAFAEIVDYVIVMTYDEHWGSSPIAGSVASLPWVEKGLQGILTEVPAEKVILGVPFYTRIWREEVQADGTLHVTSKAYGMEAVQNWLQERNLTPQWDEQTGQNYAEYHDSKEKATYKVWLEDETSMRQRVRLVQQYGLAGMASWSRFFADEGIWESIAEELQVTPFRPHTGAK